MISYLKCPCCGAGMMRKEKSAVCTGTRIHCYDFAKEGYLHMAPAQSGGGDSPEAVRSRTDFLNSGYYFPIAQKLCEILRERVPMQSVLVDAGCGEGYYGCLAAKEGFSVLGADLSKAAIRAAAKRAVREGYTNTLFMVGNLFSLPIADGVVDAVVNVFAPCVESEFCRVLKTGGILVVVSAGPKHLMGLKHAVYSRVYENDGRSDMPQDMTLLGVERLTYPIVVDCNEQIQNLFAMTPYYWRTAMADRQKLSVLQSLETEIDIEYHIYQKK